MKKNRLSHIIRSAGTMFVVVLIGCGAASGQQVDRKIRALGNGLRLSQPTSLAVSPTGERIAVSDAGANRIAVFDLNDRLLWVVGDAASITRPSAVVFDGEQALLFVQEKDPRLFRVTEQDVTTVDTVPDVSDSLSSLSSIDAIVPAPHGGYIVLDRDRGRIYRLTAAWSMKGELAPHGGGRGKVLAPTAVAVATGGQFVVSDERNYPFQVFAEDGRVLVSGPQNAPGLQRGWEGVAVAVDAREIIWIADDTDREFRLYDLNGMAVTSVPFEPGLIRPVAMTGTVDNRVLVVDESGILIYYTLE